MFRVGVDRIGLRQLREAATPSRQPASDVCPVDEVRGVFRGMALVCPRCGRLLGGI